MGKSRGKLTIIIPIAILILTGFIYINISKKNNISINNPMLPEEIVFVKSSDDIVNAGVIFNPQKNTTKHVAVIWVHGWGVNFYSPSYISIGRAIAARGYTCISINSRMHDLGNVEGYHGEKRLRGGGYWGVGSEEVRDIAAWVNFVKSQGFDKAILVGHSAGWAAVRIYETEMQDNRVAGLVLASGGVGPDLPPIDSLQYMQAVRLISENKGDELIRDPKRSFPSYISAATFMDIVNTPREEKDFFGFISPNAGITKINCPILAFYGTNDDVGSKKDLDSLQLNLSRQSLKVKLTTTMIQNADHMYTGEESQVADIITKWADNILKDEKSN
jgi:pimeloyl-ACP methyl ester carboxylesterase